MLLPPRLGNSRDYIIAEHWLAIDMTLGSEFPTAAQFLCRKIVT